MAAFMFSIIFGFISGFAEILPISAFVHQKVLSQIFGVYRLSPFDQLLIHVALLAAVYHSCRSSIRRLRRESQISTKARRHTYRSAAYFEWKLLRSALLPMLIGFAIYAVWGGSGSGLWIALFMLVNGAILLIQEHIPHGNRDASKLSCLDAVVMGGFSVLSAFPGMSRNNIVFSYAVARGVDRKSAAHYMLLLCVPALIMLCIIDLIQIATIGLGIASFVSFVFALLGALAAYIGASIAIRLFRLMADHIGFLFFAYYCWGVALLSVVLYLIS